MTKNIGNQQSAVQEGFPQPFISHEFTEEGFSRHDGAVQFSEGHKEGEHSFGFGIGRTVPSYTFQKRPGQFLEYRDFIKEGRIEDYIGPVLVLKDIAFFSLSYIVPNHKGMLRTVAAELEVPDKAAKKAAVGGGDAVVIVDGELG